MDNPVSRRLGFDDGDLLRAVVEATDTIVTVTDVSGCLAWVNDTFCRILGYSRDEVVGRQVWTFRVGADAEAGRTAFAQQSDDSTGRRFEAIWRTRDGGEVVLSWSTRVMRGPDGTVQGYVGTAIDVTAERAGTHEIVRLREMLDQTDEAVILVDLEGIITYCNAAACRLYRLDRDGLVGRSNRAFVPESEADRFAEFAAALRATGEARNMRTRRTRGDGSVVPVELRVSPVRDQQGRHVGFVSVSYDITTELELEQRARDARARASVLARLVENLADPVFHMRPDGTIGYVNAACAAVYGWGADELRDKPASLLRPMDRREPMAAFFQSIIETGGPAVIETDALHKDGHRVPVDIRARALRAGDGTYEGLAASVRDITARRRIENELRQLADTDVLTGLPNRMSFERTADAEMIRARRYSHDLGVMVCDLDRFKAVNDTHGHAGGDAVLRRFGLMLSECLRRPTDVVARMGGEEFAVLLPETNLEGTRIAAERIRMGTGELRVEHDGRLIPVTVSIGVSRVRPGEDSIAPALARADQALYLAKRNGRNRVVLAG